MSPKLGSILVLSQITNSLVEFFCPDTGLYEGILNLEISFQLLAGIAVAERFFRCGAVREFSEYMRFHTSADARAPV